MIKNYKGNDPDESKGWVLCATLKVGEKEWRVWEQRQKHSSEWVNYKICVNGRAQRKANYWVARNNATGQIGYARDFAMMRENRKNLWEKVEEYFKCQKI